MTGYLTYDANIARLDDLHHRAQRRRAARRRASLAAGGSAARTADPVTIRRATEADRAALARLAALDSARPLAGEVLLAEAGGEVLGAIEVAGSAAIADPFQPTAELVELLRVRAARLRAAATPRRPRRRSRFAYRAA
jgi:hypothetical protein